MAWFETWFKNDLAKPINVVQLQGVMFNLDNLANKIGVELEYNGQPAALEGTIAGYVIRNDGTTLNLTTNTGKDGNKAWVILPQEAYTVEGPISIVIKLVYNSAETTIGACAGYVTRSRTSSEIAPTGTVIPSLASLEAAIAAANAAAANAADATDYIAPTEEDSTASAAHAVGSYFIYNGKLMMATTAIAQGAPIVPYASGVTNYNCTEETGGLAAPVTTNKTLAMEGISKAGIVGTWTAPSESGTIATSAHAVGSYFTYNGYLYRATTAIAQGAPIVTTGENVNCTLVPGGLSSAVLENHNEIGLTAADIATVETRYNESVSTASAAHAKGSYFILGGMLYVATADIAVGDLIVTTGTGANCEEVPGGVAGEVEALSGEVADFESAIDLVTENDDVDFSTTTSKGHWLVQNGVATIELNSSSVYYAFQPIPVTVGKKYTVSIYANTAWSPIILANYDNSEYDVVEEVSVASSGRIEKELTIQSGVTHILLTKYGTQSVSVKVLEAKTDKTLTTSNVPADAKSTGDRLSILENIVVLGQDEINEFYGIGTTGIFSATLWGVTSYIDCFGVAELNVKMPILSSSISNMVCLEFYDQTKTSLSKVNANRGDTNSAEIRTIPVPEGAYYFRCTYWKYENALLYGGDWYCSFKTSQFAKYRPYQSGYIFYSPLVNQSVNEYWETDIDTELGLNLKQTTGVLLLPDSYTPTGKPTPIIMYFHGYSHYVYYDHWGDDEAFRTQKAQWASMGFAVMDCNGARNNNKTGHFTSGGSLQYSDGYHKCYEYVKQHYNVEEYCHIICVSAGGIPGINYCYWFNDVKSLQMLSAWTSLKSNQYSGTGQSAPMIEYLGCDFTDGYEATADKTIGFDPTLRILTIDGVKYLPQGKIPMKAFLGSTEEGNHIWNAMQNYITALRNAGQSVSLRIVNGATHKDICSSDILALNTEYANFCKSV
jgi:hypothetical protein